MKKTKWISGLIAATTGLALVRRYGMHSGATWDDYKQTLPSDEVIPRPDLEITNDISIRTPLKKRATFAF